MLSFPDRTKLESGLQPKRNERHSGTQMVQEKLRHWSWHLLIWSMEEAFSNTPYYCRQQKLQTQAMKVGATVLCQKVKPQ
jgi:hypothetical protein